MSLLYAVLVSLLISVSLGPGNSGYSFNVCDDVFLIFILRMVVTIPFSFSTEYPATWLSPYPIISLYERGYMKLFCKGRISFQVKGVLPARNYHSAAVQRP